MKQTDKRAKTSESACLSRMDKLIASDGMSIEDYYRVLIWNSILDVRSEESLRCLVNMAMTFSHREKNGCYDTSPEFSEYITSGEVTKRFLSKE